MFNLRVSGSAALAAFVFVLASCGSGSDDAAVTPAVSAPTTTTTEPATTTTAGPTAQEVSATYCATARMANAETIDYELINGADSTFTAAYLDIGLERMRSLELIPEEIEADFAMVVEALEEVRTRLVADDEPEFEILDEIFTTEVIAATDVLDDYEESVCGFTYDEMAIEAGLRGETSIAGAQLFTDPEGEYTIEINPEWIAEHGAIASGIELWFINDGTDGFAENLNVLTQKIPEMSTQEYLDLSSDSLSTLLEDGSVVESAIVTGHEGQELGIMIYEGTVAGSLDTFLAVFAIEGDSAVVATFVALPDEFDELSAEVVDYMFTLVAT